MTDVVERLVQDHQQLSKMSEAARFAGRETGVRVRDTSALLQDLDDAAAEITKLRGQVKMLLEGQQELCEAILGLAKRSGVPDVHVAAFADQLKRSATAIADLRGTPAVIATEGDSHE